MTNQKSVFSSGTVWEEMAGYSRAVRVGDRILVAGTTATGPDGLVGGADPAAQARFIFDKIEMAIKVLGGRMEDVVRTRVYVSNIAHWESVARVHGERFGQIRPSIRWWRRNLWGQSIWWRSRPKQWSARGVEYGLILGVLPQGYAHPTHFLQRICVVEDGQQRL